MRQSVVSAAFCYALNLLLVQFHPQEEWLYPFRFMNGISTSIRFVAGIVTPSFCRIAFAVFYSCYLSDFVVAVFYAPVFAGFLGGEIAGFVIRKGHDGAVCLGNGAEPAFGGVGKPGGVAQGVGFADDIAQRIVGVGGFCAVRGDDFGKPAQKVVFVAGYLLALRNGGHVAEAVVGIGGGQPGAGILVMLPRGTILDVAKLCSCQGAR